MKTHVSVQAAAVTAAPTLHLATYRRNILAEVIGNELFTAEEQLKTNHNVHECQDAYRLAVWLKNVRRVAGEREQAQALAALAEKAQQPTAAPAPAFIPAATSAQCDEIYRLACRLPKAEKADALRRLPKLSEAEAAAFLRGLQQRRGPRLRVPAELRGRAFQLVVIERHYEAAKVDYVREYGTGQLRPRYETMYGGELVRRVWAN